MSLHLAKFDTSNFFFFFPQSASLSNETANLGCGDIRWDLLGCEKWAFQHTGARLQLIAEGNLLPTTPLGIEEADKILLEMEMINFVPGVRCIHLSLFAQLA